MYSYIRIFSDTNIRSYHIRIIFFMRIYSDNHSYCFSNTNIFGYSFVSFFWYEYIRIFVRILFWYEYIQNLTCAPPGPKLFTHRLIFKEKLLPFCCVNYVFNFLLYHTSKILHPTSKIWYECIRIFEYFPIRIFVRIIFVSFVWYEYIRIFVRVIFFI